MKTAPGGMTGLLGVGFGLAMLIELQLDTPVYVTTAAVDIDYGGHTYVGGRMVAQDAVKSGAGLVDKVSVSLSGVPSEYIALALSTAITGKRINV